jgi:hypothetical protein
VLEGMHWEAKPFNFIDPNCGVNIVDTHKICNCVYKEEKQSKL